MFFRETQSKNSKSKVLQLVENVRTAKGPRQKLVVSLGTNFNLPKKDRRQVAEIVANRLRGNQASLFGEDPSHAAYADRIIKKIQVEGKWESAREKVQQFRQGLLPGRDAAPTAHVFINGVTHGYTRTLGPVLIGHTFWNRLGFPGILKDAGLNDRQIQTAEISVLNRLIAQDSEHSILNWLPTVALEELLGTDTGGFGDDRFYRVSDALLKRQSEIEKGLYQREKDLFSLEDCIFLYDLTDTYFEGMCAGNPKAEFSFNRKEKRTDCRQIVVALMLDGDGFVRGHRVFNGKMTDSKSLEIILNELKPDFIEKETPTIVFDRGVVSQENLELLEKYENLKYVIMCRPNEEAVFAEDFENGEFRHVEGTESNVEVSLKQSDDSVYVLCKSERRNLKESAMRNSREKKFEKELLKISGQVSKTRQNGYKDIERRIGRLKERYAAVAKYYEIEYTNWSFSYSVGESAPRQLRKSLNTLSSKVEKNGITFNGLRKKLETLPEKYPSAPVRIELKEPVLSWCAIDEKQEYERSMDGNYLLKTNRTDLNENGIRKLYIMMTGVEDAFRDLKSHLGLRPNYHQKEKRVDGHIFISVLAWHLLHSIEYTLRMNGDRLRWATVRRLMSTHCYSTIQLPTTQGTVINLRRPGVPEGVHQELYRKLDVDLSSLPHTQNLA